MAMVLLSLQLVLAGTVSRSISPATPAPGETLSVTLTVSVDSDETYYSIDEVYPSGWAVSDKGGLDNTQAGHLKDVVISNAIPKVYTYQLTVPATATKGDFSGKYMFEGDTAEIVIGGTRSVTVGAPSACPVCTEFQYCDGINTCRNYVCSGDVPEHAALCSRDDAELTASGVDNTLVSGCTSSTKCEYTCSDGYQLGNSACIPSDDSIDDPEAKGIFEKINIELKALKDKIHTDKGNDAEPTMLQKLTAIAKGIKIYFG